MAAKALMVGDSQKMSQQPIFCFETMMHMLYWSCLVYDYKRVMSAANLACCMQQPFGTLTAYFTMLSYT